MVVSNETMYEKAFDKMYSKVVTLKLKIKSLDKEIESGGSGGIDMELLIGVKNHVESELNIWSYMLFVIG